MSKASRTTHYASRTTHHVSRFTLWALYLCLTLACFYIHYYTVFLMAFQGLFVLFNARRFWAQRRPWLASQMALGLLMIPGLQLAYNFLGQAAGGIETLPTLDILRLASTALLTGFTLADNWGGWLSLLLAPVWLTGLIALLRRERVSGVFWGLFFALPVVGVIALSIDRPFFKERFLIQAQPAFELLLAAGFLALLRGSESANQRISESARERRSEGAKERESEKVVSGQRSAVSGRRSAVSGHASRITHHASRTTHHAPHFTFHVSRLLATLLLLLLLSTNGLALRNYLADPAYAKAPPWRLYHDYVSEHARPGDVMLTNFPEAAVSYYSPNELPFYVVPVERDRSVAFRLEQTEQIAGAYRRIWFLPMLRQGFDEPGDVLNWLDRHADRVHQVFFPIFHLNLYLSPPALEALMIAQPATFAHGLHLRGYQILDKEGNSRLVPTSPGEGTASAEYLFILEPEDEFTLSLYWLAAGPTDIPYTVFTHLVAADGFNRVGRDNQPVWGTYPTTQWQPNEKITDKYTLTIPAGAPPGDHRLQVGWYNTNTQERVPLLPAPGQEHRAGPPAADHIILDVIVQVKAVDNQ